MDWTDEEGTDMDVVGFDCPTLRSWSERRDFEDNIKDGDDMKGGRPEDEGCFWLEEGVWDRICVCFVGPCWADG